jgi:hypothetical protein
MRRHNVHFFALLALAITLCGTALSQAAPGSASKENMHHAKGSFEVKLTQQPSDDPTLGRYMLEKQLHGDLEGTGKGQMLTGMGTVKTSGAYVAIERITGTLDGKSGSFILQHSGTMANGAQQLNITVVPDSGTGQLAGISGRFTINVVEGKHLYDFEYTLP